MSEQPPLGIMPLTTCAIQLEQQEGHGTYEFSLTSNGRKDVWKLRTVSMAARVNWITSLRSQQGTCASFFCACIVLAPPLTAVTLRLSLAQI